MKVAASIIGKKILIKTFLSKEKPEFLLKEPLIIKHSANKFLSVFKYGVVVFWGLNKKEQSVFLKQLQPFVNHPVSKSFQEEVEVGITDEKPKIVDDRIYVRTMDNERIALISIILSRSVALDFYEHEVDKALERFEPVMKSLEEEGRAGYPTKKLLQIAGFAMNIRHLAMSQIALLDRPDIVWEDTDLSKFYDVLSDEYEIDDRHDVLKEKLEAIFRNAEFILSFIEAKKSNFLEFIIIILIVLEIMIFIYEVWFM